MVNQNQESLIELFLDRRLLIMLLLGFSAGLPIVLIFGTLSLWLTEAGVSKSTVTYFSWTALGYSFKFVWAPLVDQLRLPVLDNWLGRRRSWLLLSQIMVMSAIWLMSSIDPASGETSLVVMALAAVLLGFSSATQDIVIDAFRIESAKPKLQSLLSATYIAGYRIAMIVASAGALYLAVYFGSVRDDYDFTAWSLTYRMMSMTMLVGVLTTLFIREPKYSVSTTLTKHDSVQLVILFVICVSGFIGTYVLSSSVAGVWKEALSSWFGNKALGALLVEMMRLIFAVLIAYLIAKALIALRLIEHRVVRQSYIMPISDFFSRYGFSLAFILLGLIGLYRISDIVLGAISNVFYSELEFTKIEIANVSKIFGIVMTMVGAFLGGILALRVGVFRVLLLGAVLSAATNLLFLLLAQVGHNMPVLYFVISADNLSAGVAGAAFIAFLSALTNVKFTAMQYAIFSSLMTLFPKVLGGYSGSIVENIGYSNFFIFTALIGLPVIILILWAQRLFVLELPKESNERDR